MLPEYVFRIKETFKKHKDKVPAIQLFEEDFIREGAIFESEYTCGAMCNDFSKGHREIEQAEKKWINYLISRGVSKEDADLISRG